MNIFKTLNCSLGVGYTSISNLGMMTYITPQQLVSIIGHIDLISPLWKYPFSYFIWTPKSTAIHGNCISSTPAFAARVDGNFHAFPWFGGYLWSWRIFVQDTPPKYSIHGQAKVKADSWLGWKAKADPLTWSEGQGNIHIWKKMDILKVNNGHLTFLPWLPPTLSLVWKFDGATPNLWQSVCQSIYFKFI